MFSTRPKTKRAFIWNYKLHDNKQRTGKNENIARLQTQAMTFPHSEKQLQFRLHFYQHSTSRPRPNLWDFSTNFSLLILRGNLLNGFKFGRMELKVLVSESTMKLSKTFHKHTHKDVFDFVNNTHSNAEEICRAFWKFRICVGLFIIP